MPPYRYNYRSSYMLKDKKHVVQESLIDGEKGLEFKFIIINGDKFKRINVKETSPDEFSLKIKEDDNPETTKTLSLAEFKKFLKSTKEIEFVKNYFENDRGKYKGFDLEDNNIINENINDMYTSVKKKSKKISKKISKKKVSKILSRKKVSRKKKVVN